MRQSILSAMALATVAVMGTAVVLESQDDARARIAQAEQLMAAQGDAITEIVAESSLHGLDVHASLEQAVQQRLLDNANWLAWVDHKDTLSEKDLDSFAKSLGLWRILVYGADGKLEKSSRPGPESEELEPLISRTFINTLATGTQKEGLQGYVRARVDGQRRLVVGAARKGGGAAIVCSQVAGMDKSRDQLSPGHLIKSMARSHGISYVVLQSGNQILASTTTTVNFLPPEDDSDLRPLNEGAEYVKREFESSKGPVFEVARQMNLNPQGVAPRMVWLRVGLDATLLQQLRTDTHQRARLRSLLLAGGLILASILLLVWQRHAVLRREVLKVTRELRLKEEESQRAGKLVAMGNLAAGVAHEIRNPLNTIHMIAQALGRSSELPAGMVEKAGHIRDESARIESIVQQFLDFARPRDPVFETLDLAQVVRDTVAMHQAAHRGNGLDIVLRVHSCTAELDRHFVVEIVENLVRNAIEALPGGKGLIEVTLTCDRGLAELVVHDDGPGIPAELRENIFDLYFTTKPSGSGLGLSLVARMVTAMGGQISLDQAVEGPRGARFLVRFPLQRSKQ